MIGVKSLNNTYIIRWGGQEYLLQKGKVAIIPKNVYFAFFPRKIEDYFTISSNPTEIQLRDFLSVFVYRWQNGAKKLVGNEEETINLSYENILDFINDEFNFYETDMVYQNLNTYETEELGLREIETTKSKRGRKRTLETEIKEEKLFEKEEGEKII